MHDISGGILQVMTLFLAPEAVKIIGSPKYYRVETRIWLAHTPIPNARGAFQYAEVVDFHSSERLSKPSMHIPSKD